MLRAALREAAGATPARVTLAIVMHQTCRFDEAVELAEEALSLDARDADAWRVKGLALEMRGQVAASSEALARAAQLDPERFAEPAPLSESAFDAVVAEALEELPETFRQRLADLPIVVRETPTREMLADLEDPAPDLLGLFVGTPLTEKSVGDIARAPDVVYLFRRNLQRACDGADELRDEIRITLLHEIGHYLGMTEEDLEAAGYE
jgi:predicted Zn-dependent protease with MMP-like domain